MKAVVLKSYGGPEQLSYEDAETPKPAAGEVLVRLAATSINPIDYKVRSGAYKDRMSLQLPTILGRDIAGEVVELGAGVTKVAVGERVMALASRSYAEYVSVRADALAPIPQGMEFAQAAALPLVTLTGAQLIERGIKPREGQSLFITGSLGGVGRTAVYVAGQHHAQVIAALKSSQMAEGESLGTLGLVALEDDEGLATFKDIDCFADTVGGSVALKILPHLRHGGVYASVVGIPEEIEKFQVHADAVTATPDAARLRELAEDVAQGRFKIPVARVMKLAEIVEAHRLAEAGGTGGKIVLVP